METRVAVLAIIVRGGSSVQPLNELLHQYGQYIIGRMGVPYREKGVNIISVDLRFFFIVFLPFRCCPRARRPFWR